MILTLLQDVSKALRQPVDSTAGIYSVTNGPTSQCNFAVAWGDVIPPPTGDNQFSQTPPAVPNLETSLTQPTPPERGIIYFLTLAQARKHVADFAANC